MPLEWEEYDRQRRLRDREAGSLTPGDRRAIETMVADVLQVPRTVRETEFGSVVGYGRNAAAVARVASNLSTVFSSCGFRDLAVKVFINRAGCWVNFHKEQFSRIPGLAGNARIQQTLAAGHRRDGAGKERGYAVLEYVDGELLKTWLAAEHRPIPVDTSFEIIDEVFLRLLIPLWARGHRFWDLRAGNLVLEPGSMSLRMIDTDFFRKIHDEITGVVPGWAARDQQEVQAMKRLPGCLVGQFFPDHDGGRFRSEVSHHAVASGLLASLSALGKWPGDLESEATDAYARFRERLHADLRQQQATGRTAGRRNQSGVVFGDGLIQYGVGLVIRADSANDVDACARDLMKWSAGEDFPLSFLRELRERQEVVRATGNGAMSSLAIPLKMVRSLTRRRCRISGVVGRGPVADANAADLKLWGIDPAVTVREGGDSPVEISIWDEQYRWHKSARIYSLPRKRLRHSLAAQPVKDREISAVAVSRLNKGRLEFADHIMREGGISSLRIGMLSRHVGAADYLQALPSFHHILVSHRDGVMSQIARHCGISSCSRTVTTMDAGAERLAEQLAVSADPTAPLVVLLFPQGCLYYVNGLDPVCLRIPDGYDARSRMSRVQGTCIARSMGCGYRVPRTQTEIEEFAQWTLQTAFRGTESSALWYPGVATRAQPCWPSAATVKPRGSAGLRDDRE